MTKRKKGLPRRYDEWEPEYTPKTHNVTKDSKRERAEIRAFKLAERASELDLDKLADAGGFVCLVLIYKSGIDVFQYVMDRINPLEGAIEVVGGLYGHVQEFVDRVIGNTPAPEEPTHQKPVYFNTWLSQGQVDDIISKSLKAYIAEIAADLKKWKLAEIDLNASEWSAVGVPEYQLWLAEQAEITRLELLQTWLNENKYEDGQRPGGSP